MKNIIKIFILCSASFINGQNKKISDVEVNYHMRYVSDSLNKETYLEADMTLLLNKNESYYFNGVMVKFYQDLKHKTKTVSNVQDIANSYIPLPKIRHNVWKENDIIKVTSPLGKYNYSYNSDKIDWELLGDIKKIEKFTCHLAKATVDNDVYFAWYTTEIPFSEGPFKFKGLPGLILEIHNKNKTIEINATNIEMKKMEILKMRDAVNINLKDRAEFLLLRERYIKYPFDSNYSKEIVDRKLEQLRKINVFLD